jgi:hypothetical protein
MGVVSFAAIAMFIFDAVTSRRSHAKAWTAAEHEFVLLQHGYSLARYNPHQQQKVDGRLAAAMQHFAGRGFAILDRDGMVVGGFVNDGVKPSPRQRLKLVAARSAGGHRAELRRMSLESKDLPRATFLQRVVTRRFAVDTQDNASFIRWKEAMMICAPGRLRALRGPAKLWAYARCWWMIVTGVAPEASLPLEPKS